MGRGFMKGMLGMGMGRGCGGGLDCWVVSCAGGIAIVWGLELGGSSLEKSVDFVWCVWKRGDDLRQKTQDTGL